MRKPLRICLIGSAQSIHVKRWGRFLASKGHNVHILSVFHDVIEGAKVWTLPTKERYGNICYFLSLPKVYWLLKRLNADIVHLHYLGGSAFYFPLISPYVVVSSPWGDDIYALKNPLKKTAVAHTFKKSKRILATSKEMAGIVEKRFNIESKRIISCSWGIDTSVFRPAPNEERIALRKELGIPPSAFVIFSNRIMAPGYRTDLIVESFLAAQQKSDNLFLVLLEGPVPSDRAFKYRNHISSMVATKNSIRVLAGVIPPTDMSGYLRISDLVISIPVSDQRASSVLEALACSPVVILSNLPAYQELIQEGYEAIILQNVERESLLQAILTVRREGLHLKRTALAANYALIQKQEDWNSQADKVEAVYYALLNKEW